MKGNLLRPPQTAAEWIADLLRVVGVVCVVIALMGWSATAGGIVALALPGLVTPRLIGARAWVDILYGITVLIAVWSNVLDLYTTVMAWDLVVHFALTGLTAIMLYLLFARADIVAQPELRHSTTIVLTTTMGLALSAVWEMLEWIGWAFISDGIYVEYQDTIGDMAAGGLGSVAAGVVLAFVPLLRTDADRYR